MRLRTLAAFSLLMILFGWAVGVLLGQLPVAQAQAADPGQPGWLWMVTPAPSPATVFEAATRVIQERADQTRLFATYGVPLRIITMTPSPTPMLLEHTPRPASQATATYLDLLWGAIAITTGTPTPLPDNAVTATPTYLYVLLRDVEALRAHMQPTQTPTSTPTPTPKVRSMPQALIGKIAFRSSFLGRRSGVWPVFIVDPDGRDPAFLTGLPAYSPWEYTYSLDRDRMSPGGDHFAYERKVSDHTDLFLAPSAEGPHHQLTFVGKGAAYNPAWSPDGRHVAFTSNQEGDDDVFVVDIRDPSRPNPRTTKLTRDDDWQSDKHPSYSPDGSQIVFHSNRSGRSQIWVMNADGSDPHRVLDVDAECWDPVWIKGW